MVLWGFSERTVGLRIRSSGDTWGGEALERILNVWSVGRWVDGPFLIDSVSMRVQSTWCGLAHAIIPHADWLVLDRVVLGRLCDGCGS